MKNALYGCADPDLLRSRINVAVFFQLVPLYQEQYGWSTVVTAVHFLPTGVFGGAISTVASSFVTKVNPKWSILGGLVFVFIGSMILPFANTSAKYWSHTFPAFTIGTLGNMTVFINANIAIFMKCVIKFQGFIPPFQLVKFQHAT